jgi:hypothetical protein
MEMDLTRHILINSETFLAEDEAALINIKYAKKRIVAIELQESMVKVTYESDTYTKELNERNKISIVRRLNNKLTLVKTRIKKNIYSNDGTKNIYLIRKELIANYKELILVSEILSKSHHNSIILVDWKTNALEEFIFRGHTIISDDGNHLSKWSVGEIPDYLIFFARHFKFKIHQSIKDLNGIRVEEIEEKFIYEFVNQKKKIKAKVNLFLYDSFTLQNRIKPLGIQNRETWHPSLFGPFVTRNAVNSFLVEDIGLFSIEILKEVVKYQLNLIKTSEITEFQDAIRIKLPGLLIPVNSRDFDNFLQKELVDGKCYKFRSNSRSFVEIHQCNSKACKIDEIENLNFYHYQGMYPKSNANFLSAKKRDSNSYKAFCMVLPPYSSSSGGIVALYKLHDILVKHGFDVYVLPYNPTGSFPYFRDANILFNSEFKVKAEKLIWIYADTVASIPFDAEIQIQWQLNRPGYLAATSLGSYRVKPKYVYKYSDVISDSIQEKLYISNFDFELFKPQKSYTKNGPIYYLGKSSNINISEFKKYYSYPSKIINRSFPLREELPSMLASASMLISFDTLSAINIEANLCGTPTLVVTNKQSLYKEIDIRKFELPTLGVIFNSSELDKIPKLDNDYYQNFIDKSNNLENETVSNFLAFLDKI